MTLAVMQPYFFPYIGYFQLINTADIFVFYDDVNFIKQGWVNKNKILSNGKEMNITVPCKKVSSFKHINEVEHLLNAKAKTKMFRSIQQSYSKAPFVKEVLPVIDNGLNIQDKTIAEICISGIKSICSYLEVKTEFKVSSKDYIDNQPLERAERLIDIAKQNNSNHYINAIGGQSLYDKSYFKAKGIELNFLQTEQIIYKQLDKPFVPNLSIIDVLMFNSKAQVKEFLNQYTLV